MRPIALALAVVTALSLTSTAHGEEVPSGKVPGNGKPPAVTPGGSWNGTSTIIQPGDSDGNPYVRLATPGMVVIQHKSNVTITSAATDTSTVPFQTSQYRMLYALVRVKSITAGWGGALDIAIKANTSATADSTALGWYFKMGGGTHGGRVAMLSGPIDRWQMIPMADTLSGLPFQAPYAALSLFNRAGSQLILDLWLLGVPW